MKTDVLIVGAGIAGLNMACRLAEKRPDLKITILAKGKLSDCNSELAQGGIAISPRTVKGLKKHVNDTYISGAKYTDPKQLEELLKDSPHVEQQLLWYGIEFDRTSDGKLHRIKEGGHSEGRILHVRDTSGAAIMDKIRNRASTYSNLNILDYYIMTELLVESNKCIGVRVANVKAQQWERILSGATIIATGGVGYLYANSTNNLHSTGDGIALAWEKGAVISDMEFIQFHPTALDQKQQGQFFLITEAIRGAGAILRNDKGERFMEKYDARLELAPRDIVARAITLEKEKSNVVFLDCRHIAPSVLEAHFPTIYERCKQEHLDLSADFVPITPVEHFVCGGIVTNEIGQTSIDQLFACGECARTGLHGANRLASNSLLEAMIMSERIAQFLLDCNLESNNCHDQQLSYPSLNKKELKQINELKQLIQETMQSEGGIIRTNYGLTMAKDRLSDSLEKWKKNYFDHPYWYEVKNMLLVALLILIAASERKENLGVHFNMNHHSKNRA